MNLEKNCYCKDKKFYWWWGSRGIIIPLNIDDSFGIFEALYEINSEFDITVSEEDSFDIKW